MTDVLIEERDTREGEDAGPRDGTERHVGGTAEMTEAEAGGVVGTPRGQERSGDPAGTVMSDFRPPERLEHNVCVLSTSVLLLCDGCLRMLTPVPGDLSFYLHQLTVWPPSGVDLSAQQAREGLGGDENRENRPPRHPHPLKEGADL